MSDVLPSRLVPSAIGFLASFGSMGAALLPWLAGNLAQQYGMWILLPYVIALTAIMLVLWVIMQTRPTRPEEIHISQSRLDSDIFR